MQVVMIILIRRINKNHSSTISYNRNRYNCHDEIYLKSDELSYESMFVMKLVKS